MNLLPSLMRTGVPIVYAVLIRLGLGNLLVSLGMPADSTTTVVTAIAAVILTLVIYAVLRELEQIRPKLGVLLGWPSAPTYAGAESSLLTQMRSELAALEARLLPAIIERILTAPAPAPAAPEKPAPAKEAPASRPAAKKATAAKRPAAKKATAPTTTKASK